MRNIVTIDGPGGVGKGTLAQALAREYGWAYLDSGALYRLSALHLQRLGLEDADSDSQCRALQTMKIRFVQENGEVAAYLQEKKVGSALRLESTGQRASQLAAKAEIRAALLDFQRQFAADEHLVCDGRDMGTVVFPQAGLKVFLDADMRERALRRYKQLMRKGESVSLAALEQEIAERDARDRNRPIAPLKPASDAVVIDTTALSVNEVLEQVKSLVQARFFN